MNTLDIKPGERVKDVHFTEDNLSVDLIDGRTITVPLAWYPRLLHATAEQRKNWQVCEGILSDRIFSFLVCCGKMPSDKIVLWKPTFIMPVEDRSF